MPNLDQLNQYAREMAAEYEIATSGRVSRRKFPKLEDDNLILIQAYKSTNEEVKSKGNIVPAAEWLLDNFYVIEEQIKEIQQSIPRDFYKELPILIKGKHKGYSRVYGIAMEMIAFTDGRIDEDIIVDFLKEYQKEVPLTSEELWAIPLMIRICLLQKIKDIAIYIIESLKERKLADEWALKLVDGLIKSKEDDHPKESLRNIITEHDTTIGFIKPAYAERLLQRLRDEGADAAPIIRWVDGKLAVQHTGADEIIQLAHQQQATNQVSMGNAVTSLRLVSGLKWEDIYEELSILENILRQDPAMIYPLMEFASRDYYRHSLEKLSKMYKVDEILIAQKAVECALENDEASEERFRHIGYYIIDKGRSTLEKRLNKKKKVSLDRQLVEHALYYYFGAIGVLTLGFMLFFLSYVNYPENNLILINVLITAIVSFIPILSIVTGLVHWIITRICNPSHLPKLELKDGIPQRYRTMVVIPTLLTSEKRVIELIEQMEVFYLANQEENLHFALVGDYKDGPSEKYDDDNIIIETAKKLINELNQRYGQDRNDIFFFFHRHRQWNANQKSWMGWERKRGALAEFNALLLGNKETSYSTKVGDLSVLGKIVYVITLDADTQLPRDTAKKLIGAMAHPLNAPVLNSDGTRVIDGYGLLQPRIGVAVDSASRSFFSLTFSGQTGIDPYTSAVSDVYQDLFGEGIYTGKGIYHLNVFNKVLEGSIPENSVLSHDLLEGSYVRAGLVTDVELVDGYPSHYIAYSMRLHRWVRGDWQLLPWLSSRIRNKNGESIKNPLNTISKWKIIDNLRRSLLSPALFLLILLGCTFLPGPLVLWIGLAFITLIFPLVTDLAGTFLSKYQSSYSNVKLTDVFYGAKSLIWQIILTFVFLGHQAYAMADAIIRSVWRVSFTHKNMLEWVTAADSEKKFKGELRDFWRKMKESVFISIGSFIVIVLVNPSVWPLGSIIFATWVAAPYIAFRASKPKSKRTPALSEEQVGKIRRIARKTWRYFDELVVERENWLPPDNYQQEPPLGVAHRTSPTNIGLHLLSILAAHDLGYIGTLDVIQRVKKTVNTMRKLEKWKGHYYNWYNTLNLNPLKPLYVSTVDNGNFIGYLITLNQGMEELLKRPLIKKENIIGLKDVLFVDCEKEDLEHQSLLNMFLTTNSISVTEWQMLLDDLKGQGQVMDELITKYEEEIELFIPWVKLLQKIPAPLLNEKGAYRGASRKLSELLEKLNGPLTLQGILDNYLGILKSLSETIAALHKDAYKSPGFQDANSWLKQLEFTLASSHSSIKGFVAQCWEIHRDIDNIIKEMDFKLLYDEKRELFSIGFNVEDGQLTKSYYDLLASEARQASFIAIAKGDIPQKHWFKLGRSLTLVGDLRVLISWSGTMFEYLMPLLIMKKYDYTLLDETYTAVVRGQKQYTEQRRIPWGISESGFYAFDLHLNFQYKAFGIPQLGLKRGLVNDMVIAPYATMLALPIEPVSAFKNIEVLLDEGMDGHYGLYEAIDYTPERLPKKRKSMVVKSFMVHHQGMSLLAINNYLNNNIMQARFHSVPMIKATELLLQERMPSKEIYIKEYEEGEALDPEQSRQHQEIRARRTFSSPDTPIPETNLLSNGNYTVMLTNSGGGFSQYLGQAVSRWREDTTRDNWGMMFYISNLNANNFWSSTYHAVGITPEEYKVVFESDSVMYHRRDGNIETKTEVVVSPEYNGEVRRISLTNHSRNSRVLDITSYFEIVLTTFAADNAHPAFSNLFVQTEFIPEYNALLATRRPRDKKQKTIWLIHTAILEGDSIGNLQYETDRAKFLGRGRTLRNPQVMDPEFPLSDTVGAVLDPIMSIRKRVHIAPGETARVSFITGVADTKDAAIALARECQISGLSNRAFELAWTHSQVELRYLNITADQANLYQAIASQILYSASHRQWKQEMVKENKKGQSSLWSNGISGDMPVVTIRISQLEHMELVKQILTAHEYLRLKGLLIDLILLNEYGNSYEQPVQDKLRELVSISHARDLQDKPGGVFLRQSNTIPEEDIRLLFSTSRLVLDGNDGSIASQLLIEEDENSFDALDTKPVNYKILSHNDALPPQNLLYQNDIGGFNNDGSEYIIHLEKDLNTPLPWSNIIANPDFGFLVTESGSGYTWCKNSRENKLTPWSNDPVSDPSGEVLFLRDDMTGEYWTITPLPIRQKESYVIRHGQGYSIFEHNSHGLIQRQSMFVPIEESVKVICTTLRNVSDQSRTLSLTYYAEWVLGVNKDKNAPFIVTQYDEQTDALLAYNHYNEEFSNRIAFLASNIEIYTYTADRKEFIGRNCSLSEPKAMLMKTMSHRIGACYDPCSAIQVKVDLEPGEEKEIVFLLGQGDDYEQVQRIINTYRLDGSVEKALEDVKAFWDKKLDTLHVKTPDQSMDLLLNRWLIYQTYACRIWARTGFYQAGGAFGFRDQLQDVMALIYSAPERMREQIILSAAHQFKEGDVQHWWHPPFRGIRTRITDDLLFLPFVTADYIEGSGDWSILDQDVNYIEDDPLGPNEHDRYRIPKVSNEKANIYQHCIKSIERSMQFGSNGLPLIGGGDWNDGMDKVGIEGKGESVWLGWFLYTTLNRFIPICREREDQDIVEKYEKAAETLLSSIEQNAWDGGWYRRAYFDDGTLLGSEKNEECQIDSISQSWAVISGAAKPNRIHSAMQAVQNYLVDEEAGLIKLLSPPFNKSNLEPGYIKGYVPGVRENGGQYSHAAVWTVLAFAHLGDGNKAWKLFHLINPINHTRTRLGVNKYKAEPYVMAADVYAVPPHTGRGGWTWYTGSAGWMYRVGIESILGFKLKDNSFTIDPCIPNDWDQYEIEYDYRGTLYKIKVENPNKVSNGVATIALDNQYATDMMIPLLDDGKEHNVLVIMGPINDD